MKKFIIAFLITTVAFAQENSERVVEVSLNACECISEIDTKLDYEAKSTEIKECIKSANSSYQLTNSILNVSEEIAKDKKETKDVSKDTIQAKKEYTISFYPEKDYQEIEAYLLETCGDMKSIYFSTDKKSRKSVSKNEEALAYYVAANQLKDDADYEKAIELYKKALEIDEKFAFAWDNLGITYRKLNRFEDAIFAYKKSLKIDPKGTMPLVNIAIVYQLIGEYDNSIKYYNKLKKYNKDNPEAYFGLARMYFIKENYKEASDNILKAYILYSKIESPYKSDAEQILSAIYQQLKAKDQLDILKDAAKANKIDLGL